MVKMSVEVELNKGEVTKYRRHGNGRGLISPSAEVNLSAFVSSAAYVESEAQIGAQSWIGQGSWIDHGAILGARVFVGANVHVGADAFVGNDARLGSNTHIGRGAFIADGAIIDHEIRVPDFADVTARPTTRARSAPQGGPLTAPWLDRAGWRQIWCARRRPAARPPVPPVTARVP